MSRDLDSELSPDARQVIADSRMFGEPSDADRERVRARWLATVAAGTGLASLSTAARAAGTTGWGVKTAGIALAIAAGAAGLFIARQYSPDRSSESVVPPRPSGSLDMPVAPAAPQPAEVKPASPDASAKPAPVTPSEGSDRPSAPPQAAVSAPTETAPPLQPEGVAVDHEDVGAAPVRPLRTATSEATAPRVNARSPAARSSEPRSSRLSDELALVSEIRMSIQQGASDRALALLGDYRRRFPSPALGMEADALNVDALCQSGQKDAAQRAVTAFEAAWPASPLQERVRTACP